MAAGNEPDVAYMNPPIAYSLAENDKLVNIKELAGQDDTFSFDDYVPGVWFATDEDMVIGRRIGIAAYCLYYNVDALEAAGLEPYSTDWKNPMDWDTFVANCKALTYDRNGLHPDDEGFDPENIEQYGFSLSKDRVPVLLAASGIQWTNEDGTEFTIASEEGIDALQKFADLIHVHHVCPTPVQSEGLPGASVSLTSGMVASNLDGNWMCADFAAAGANFNIGVLPSIYPEKYSAFEDCGPVVIFKSCDNLELAWDFYKNLGMYDTLFPLFLGAWFGGGASNQFLLRQFLMGIPKALDEAAYIDGAGYFRIFVSIVLPLSTSALIVVSMFSFLFYWNDFFSPLIYLEDYKNYTIALGLQSFVSQYSSQWMLLMAAATIGVLPAIIVFLLGQKYLLEGIALTGLKG